MAEKVRIPPKGTQFLTVTLSPKIYDKPPKYQFLATINQIIRVLERFCLDYCLVTELTDQGNVHYHAWIHQRNRNNQCRLCVALKKLKYIGFIKINKEDITETERTYNYMLGHDKSGCNLDAAYQEIKMADVVSNYSIIKLNKNTLENNILQINIQNAIQELQESCQESSSIYLEQPNSCSSDCSERIQNCSPITGLD